MFSRRSGWDLRPNALARAVADRKARGDTLIEERGGAERRVGSPTEGRRADRGWIDLTETNPTRCGLGPSRQSLRDALTIAGVERYDPDPLGMQSAREAVAAYYLERGRIVDPSSLVLTASTSEAYAWLFKLLADPGDRILVPRPGYPLSDYLADLEQLELAHYGLRFDGAWRLDLDGIERSVADARDLRAIVVVSPGNPTGAFLQSAELDRLLALCAEHGLALVCDEVFSDYAFASDPARVETLAGELSVPALTFTLSGFSKVLALPQAKLGWIATGGPSTLRRQALARLEVIADTYLSVGTPVQLAAPALLAEREPVQGAVMARIRGNLAALQVAVVDSPVTVLRPEGGWQAILRVPRTRSDEAWALSLLEEENVLVQPGYYFDFDSPGYLVASLLPGPTAFTTATRRLVAHVRRHAP